MTTYHDTDDEWEDDDDSGDDSADDSDEAPTAPCPYCKREIFEDVHRCPYCERTISDDDRAVGTKPVWVTVTALICLGCAVWWLFATFGSVFQ
jgi:hypothetical protein